MKYTEEFDRRIAEVTKERGEVYGHPYDDFGRVAMLQLVLRGCHDAKLRHVLNMIAVKMVRIMATPDHFDSWLDIAGYARTACMIIDKQNALNSSREDVTNE